ncbi:hypothetical protein HII17_07955 [Thalassotalea sp. M1531]|uniref:DUF6436 domain-containing protein n=1 Tax=Thalassotalea algicola TaxID=2716224 RepID=A0A7Y0LBY8_9GAMM|nr:DUF6436 domain-containing protein [Thalassotalea algicola]NMP31492.1 hypothetical protein [Thalassotalea algicola]
MHGLNKPTHLKRHWVIAVSWLLFTFAAFAVVISEQLVAFDPHKKLENPDLSSAAKLFSRYLDGGKSQISEKTVIIHFSQEECRCSQFSEKHIATINSIAANNQYEIAEVKLNKGDQPLLIPATPSVAILEEGNLVYFGPYGQGIACSKTNGFAQTVLNNLEKGFAANIIVDKAKGCYCHT